MKKANVVVALICVAAAVILSVLYVTLGFEKYDHAQNFIIAGIWILLLAALIGIVTSREGIRKKLIRRIYISPATLYNAEYGPAGRAWALPGDSAAEFTGFAVNVLSNLRYGFSVAEKPTGFEPQYVVESETFKFNGDATSGVTVSEWRGAVDRCVRNQQGQMEIKSIGAYSSQAELEALLKSKGIFS